MKRTTSEPAPRTAEDQEARGIVIRPGSEKPIPVACWAYVWSADDDTVEHHWHELVPATRTG